MANKFTTKVTNEGLNLLQLASQQDKKVEFINVIASSTAYSENQLISETYDDINSRASKNQTGTINNLTIDKNITKMELVFDGHDIKSDYTLNSIFLIAKLTDSQDLKLFAILKATQPQYMNSYDGSGSTNLQINLGVKFSNNDKVTLQIDTAAIATLGDLSNLRNETQAKLDKETTRATEKEKNLALDIETEKNRAIKAENTLQTNIDTIDSRAQSEEKKLSNKLDTETTRAIQSEQELQGKVETEKNRAQSKEDELKSLINSNKQTLNETVLNEQNRAIQAEENLQSKITSEQNRAMTKENTLDSKIVQANKDIETEKSRAIAAEKDLQNYIDGGMDRVIIGGNEIRRLVYSNQKRLDAKDNHIFINNKSDDVNNILDVVDKYNTKNVIQSLAGDEWGSAVGIGNAGLTVIGGGESSSTLLHHVKNQKAINGTVYQPQNEELFLASDTNVKIITNTQDANNTANYKVTNFDVNGNVQITGKIYSNKTSKSIEDQIKDETTRAQSEEKRIDDKINYLSNNKSIKEVTVNDMNDLVQEGIYFSKKQLNNLDTRFAGENNFIIITGNQDYISQIVMSEVGIIISRYREEGKWSEWIKMIHYEDLKRLPLSDINPDINNLVKTVSEIKERQNRPPTGYILNTSTKPWKLLFDNGCIVYNSRYWNNNEIFRPDPSNQRGRGDYPVYSIPDTIMNVLKGLILYSEFKNSNWDGGFFAGTTVENPINNGDKYNWDGTKIKKDGTSAGNRAIFARTIYELGIWSDEIVEELGAVRKAGN